VEVIYIHPSEASHTVPSPYYYSYVDSADVMRSTSLGHQEWIRHRGARPEWERFLLQVDYQTNAEETEIHLLRRIADSLERLVVLLERFIASH